MSPNGRSGRGAQDLDRPIAALLERCAQLLGADLATVGKLAANIEPYLRADGTRIWSLMQPDRQLRPAATAGAAAATSTADRHRPPMQHQSGRPLAASMVRSRHRWTWPLDQA
jgi:hypothetical protein